MKMQRLLRMSPSEVAGRTRQELRKLLERVGGTEPNPFADERQLRRCAAAILDGSVPFFAGAVSPEVPGLLGEHFPSVCEGVVAAADKLMAHRFDLLGYRDLRFGDPVDWQLDPVLGRRAPLIHWTRIDPLDVDRVGDVKVTWELNRHQWLVTLGQAYLLRGDSRYARCAVDDIEAWIDANPVGFGINWTSSLEVAYRAIAWCWMIHLCRSSPVLDVPRLTRILRALAAHAARVERYLSYHFSPNTHLTGEALGLVYAGTVLCDLEAAPRWRSLGESILAEQAEKQVLPDGVYFEQSSCYQRYSVDIYLHWLLLAERAGAGIPQRVVDSILGMLDFLLAIQRSDGSLPAFGDADGGWLLPLQPRRSDDARAQLAVAAARFRRPDYAWGAGGVATEALWLVGPEAARDPVEPAPPDRPPSTLFPQGGWAVLRDGWDPGGHELLFDVGPLGCPISSGHGHADLLSIQASFFDEPIIVDGGTYSYADPEWRDALRLTFVKNTITLDGRSQADPDGPFSWKQRPRAQLERWVSRAGFDLVSASHTAFPSLLHRRTLYFTRRRGFLMIDELEGEGEHLIEMRFQLAPGARVVRMGSWLRFIGVGGHGVDLRPQTAVLLDVAVHQGELAPPQGWVSHDYGRRVPAPLVVLSARARLPLSIVTSFVPRFQCAELPES